MTDQEVEMGKDNTQTADPVATATPPEEKAAPDPKRNSTRPKPPAATSTPVRVTFDELQEFLAELEHDVELVEHQVVRGFERHDPPGEGFGLQRVDLIAGYVARGVVVEVVQPVGTLWNDGGDPDTKTREAIAAWREELLSACRAHVLDVRGGRYGPL